MTYAHIRYSAVAVLALCPPALAQENASELAQAEGLARAAIRICFADDQDAAEELMRLSNKYLRALSASSGTPLVLLQQTTREYGQRFDSKDYGSRCQ